MLVPLDPTLDLLPSLHLFFRVSRLLQLRFFAGSCHRGSQRRVRVCCDRHGYQPGVKMLEI